MINKDSKATSSFSHLIYESILWRGVFFLSSLVLNVLIARVYQAPVSGWVFYISNYYTLFILLLGFSLETGIGFYASKNEVAVNRLLGFSLALSAAACIPVLVFFCVYMPAPFRRAESGFVFFSAVCFISGNILMSCCNSLFYARGHFRLPNIVAVAINIALIPVLFLYSGRGALPVDRDIFLYLYFFSFLLQGLLCFILAWPGRGAGWFSFPSMAELKKIGGYAAKAFVANLVFFILYRVDYWFVEKYCTPVALGNYIQVSKLAQLFFLLPSFMASAVFPLTAGGRREEVNKNLKSMAIGLLAVYSLVCGVLALTGKWLFPFLFGPSFGQMYVPFLLLVPGILSLSMLYPFTAYYAGKNLVKVNIWGALPALAVIIAGDIIFIPVYGIAAAALVSSVGYIVYQVYVMRVYKKEYRIASRELFTVTRSELYWIRDIIINNAFRRKHHEQ